MALAISDRKGIEVLCQSTVAVSKEENFISETEKEENTRASSDTSLEGVVKETWTQSKGRVQCVPDAILDTLG